MRVAPGELITIDEQGMRAEVLVSLPRKALCVFEYIYFSDATSQFNGRFTYEVREALGRELAQEHPIEADLVIPVPDSSIPAALGYAAQSGIPYGQAIIKNRYSDRTFIKPDQRLRQLEVDLKFNLVKPKIDGKRLVVVDDSIVRGNTMKRLVAAMRHQGVEEIHLRSSSPPLRHPCYFGIDIPQENELIAAGPHDSSRWRTISAWIAWVTSVSTAWGAPSPPPARSPILTMSKPLACCTANSATAAWNGAAGHITRWRRRRSRPYH